MSHKHTLWHLFRCLTSAPIKNYSANVWQARLVHTDVDSGWSQMIVTSRLWIDEDGDGDGGGGGEALGPRHQYRNVAVYVAHTISGAQVPTPCPCQRCHTSDCQWRMVETSTDAVQLCPSRDVCLRLLQVLTGVVRRNETTCDLLITSLHGEYRRSDIGMKRERMSNSTVSTVPVACHQLWREFKSAAAAE